MIIPCDCAAGLAAGTYTLYVKDVNNCYSSTTVTVGLTQLPRVSAFSIPASCNSSDGAVVASGTLGTAPFLFSLDGTLYQASGTFNNLAAGFYTVYIKDARGCISTTGLNVANLSGPSITNTVTTAGNCGNATGTITVTATGAAVPLQYSINGVTFQAGTGFTGLLPGNYTVTVKDANGCLTTRPVVVAATSGPQVLTAAIVHAACGNANGSITAAASGGVGALQYSINGTAYQAGTLFNGLAAGPYTLYVKDINGCIKSIPVTVLNLLAPAITATASPATCGANDGTITAEATGGTGALNYSINGVTFQASNVFTGLAAGTYTVTVRDSRNCSTTASVTITTAGATVTPTFNPVGPVCSGAVLAPLPTTSLNGITGTWAPAMNNTATTTYTFTPTAGQCANPVTLTIVVNPKPGPILIYHN